MKDREDASDTKVNDADMAWQQRKDKSAIIALVAYRRNLSCAVVGDDQDQSCVSNSASSHR